MNAIFLISRILFAALFLGASIGHLAKSEALAQFAAYKGAPGGKAGVRLMGVLFLVGGLSVLLGVYGDVGALVLIVALIPLTFIMHTFWKETDEQARTLEQGNFNKNIALMGGSLAFFLLFAGFGSELGWTITHSLISL